MPRKTPATAQRFGAKSLKKLYKIVAKAAATVLSLIFKSHGVPFQAFQKGVLECKFGLHKPHYDVGPAKVPTVGHACVSDCSYVSSSKSIRPNFAVGYTLGAQGRPRP